MSPPFKDNNVESKEESLTQKDTASNDVGWQSVGRKGGVSNKYKIPVQNKFEVLLELYEDGDFTKNQKSYQCEECQIRISKNPC